MATIFVNKYLMTSRVRAGETVEQKNKKVLRGGLVGTGVVARLRVQALTQDSRVGGVRVAGRAHAATPAQRRAHIVHISRAPAPLAGVGGLAPVRGCPRPRAACRAGCYKSAAAARRRGPQAQRRRRRARPPCDRTSDASTCWGLVVFGVSGDWLLLW